MSPSVPSSPRLLFRSWRAGDLPLARQLWGDPRVTALIDARGPLDPVQVEDRLQKEIACEREHGVQYWPMFLRDTNELAGCCGLRPRDPARRVFELGFHLCASQWGKGIATAAARAVVEHAFDVRDARALFAGHNPKNEASRRVLEKLGFRHTHDELYEPTGLMHPSYLLSREELAR